MAAPENQVLQQLQQAVSEGATIEQLAPQVLQMTQGDTNMATELLTKAGFPKEQVSNQIDQIANQMEQQAMNQSQQGRPAPEGTPTPEGAQAQAEPPAQAGMPPMQMGGMAKEREPQNPFMQMMQQGGKQDFDAIRKQMVKEFRKGGINKNPMDTSSTEAYVGDIKNRLTAKMFAGYAINKVGNDFEQMRDAAVQSMKYGGKVLPKAENGIVTADDGVPFFEPEKGEFHEGLKKYGINSLDELKALDRDQYMETMQKLNNDIIAESPLGKYLTENNMTLDDFYANPNTQADIITKAQEKFGPAPAPESIEDFSAKNPLPNPDVEVTPESMTDPDNPNNTVGYQGTEEQKEEEKKAEEEQQKQVQATKTATDDSTQDESSTEKSLSGKFDMTTAEFLGTPIQDMVRGVQGVAQAFGEKEATDQIQFKGFGSMAGMSKEEMAEAIKSGAIRTGGIEDIYTRGDARRLAKGKTHRGLFGMGKKINPYGKRVFFDQTPVDQANNVEPNPDANVDPNNTQEVNQANANLINKETPEIAAMRNAIDQKGLTKRQQRAMANVDGVPNNPQSQTQGYQQTDYQNEIDAQYNTALANLKAQGIDNPTKDQLNNAIDLVEEVRKMSGVAPGEMQPENWGVDYDQYQAAVQKLGGLTPTQLFQMALGGIIWKDSQLKMQRPFMPFLQNGGNVPEGYHRMPDGSIMADAAHYKGGGVGGYKNEGYIDFEPIYQQEINVGAIGQGVYDFASGVNELAKSAIRYVPEEEREANRNVNRLFRPKNRGSLIEGLYDPQTGQMAAQDAGDTIFGGQRGDRAVRQDSGITGEFAAKYGLEVGQEITLSRNELRALRSAGYILTPKK